jgi:hypothetical protein
VAVAEEEAVVARVEEIAPAQADPVRPLEAAVPAAVADAL